MSKMKDLLKEQGKYYGYGLGEFGFTFFLMFIAYLLYQKKYTLDEEEYDRICAELGKKEA